MRSLHDLMEQPALLAWSEFTAPREAIIAK
jgi:hypothetical protein